MGLEWMERLAKQRERLEAQRRRILAQKGILAQEAKSELKLIPPAEGESKLKRRRGWKVAQPSKLTHLEGFYTSPKSSDALSERRIAKESRFSGKWDRRTAKWDRRARKHRW